MLPKNADCCFRDGDQWACVRPDFVNLQESLAGFGPTMNEARLDLERLEESAASESRE